MKRRTLRKSDKAILVQMYGNRCRNCGSDENIEWHHIVPLEIGGNDTYENMVPLCYTCHQAVTHHELILATIGRRHPVGGRKKKIPNDYEDILWRYIKCEIGKAECVRLLGLSETNHVSDSPWYREFLDKNGIDYIKNNVDHRRKKSKFVADGTIVGCINYKDGRVENCVWHGENTVSMPVRQRKFVPVDKNKWLLVDDVPDKLPTVNPGFVDLSLTDGFRGVI